MANSHGRVRCAYQSIPFIAETNFATELFWYAQRTLLRCATDRAGVPIGTIGHLKVDAPLGSIEFDLLDFQRTLQAKGCGE